MAWSDNIFETVFQADYDAYIRYADQTVVSSANNNGTFSLLLEVGKTYKIILKMSNRFRGGDYPSSDPMGQVIQNYWCHSDDHNDATCVDAVREYTITPANPYVFIMYYTSTGNLYRQEIFDSVQVLEYIPDPVVISHTVTVTNGYGSGEYAEESRVSCLANVYENKTFSRWYATGITLSSGDLVSQSISFIMPTNDVTLVATYIDTPDILVEYVSIFLEPSTISVGGTSEISTEVLPDNATYPTVTLTIDDPTICSISEGIVTGLRAGATTIRGSCADGITCAARITVVTDRDATDADYNTDSREVHLKLDIYFDGLEAAPFTITRSDYLIDCDILDEAGAESDNPLGAVSANELVFSLFNAGGMFNPNNTSGPFYGKIKTGVPIKPHIRPNIAGVGWTQMGIYYVNDWSSIVTGSAVSVVAHDKLQNVFLEATPLMPVKTNKTFKQFFEDVFHALGYSAIVDNISAMVAYTFIDGEPLDFIQEMAHGAIAMCTCDKSGNIVVKQLMGNRETRATLTDSDQIISINLTQSIIKTYGGVELGYVLPQLTDQTEVLGLKDFSVPTGVFMHNNLKFTKSPVRAVCSLSAVNASQEVTIIDFNSTPFYISVVTQNRNSETTCDVSITGVAVDLMESAITDNANNLLKVSNKYIQNTSYASIYKTLLTELITNEIPTLSLTIRGNPLLNVGDKIHISSIKYGLEYDGVVQRLSYKYNGSLTCEMVLLNADILEV